MDSSIRLTALKSRMGIEPETASLALEAFIREHVEKLERGGIILGLSGGVDSAVVAALCRRAVGPDKVLALLMPEKDSKAEHLRDAVDLAKGLNIEARLIDMSPYLKKLGAYRLFALNKVPFPGRLRGTLVRKAYKYYERKTGETPFSASVLGFKDKEFGSYLKSSNAYYRIKHRLRMVLLYLYAELENRLVVGAANRSEYKIGFFVKHGCDDAADVMPLLGLYKTQVRELARYLSIPARIIDKPPSPDIIPGVIDEEAIGIPYEQLDLILLALEEGWASHEIACALGTEEQTVMRVSNLIRKSEHMRRVYTPAKNSI